MKRLASTLLVLLPVSAFAADGIDLTRGPDTTVYGTCVPSLLVENKSAETVDYLEVDLVLDLVDGRRRTVELKSAYREGVLYPIAPGAKGVLKQHLDTSRSLGVACDQVKARKVGRIICESSNKACASPVSVQP